MSTPEIQKLLAYGSGKHKRISDALKDRLRMSEQGMKARYKQMAQNEELFQAYIPEREVDALRRNERETRGVPHYRTVEIPYSYATVMTAHTYYTSVFLARQPVMQISGRHGEAETNKVAVESLLQYQMQVGMMTLALFIWLLDPGKYGYGVIGHHWDREAIRVRRTVMKPKSFLGMPIPGTEREVSEVAEVTGYEGNRTFNVRPQDFFPDPRHAIIHYQKGEFCARYVETPWNEIYEGEKAGRYFNYEKLKAMRNSRDNQENGQISRDRGSSNVTSLPDESKVEGGYDVPVGLVKGHEVYLKLIPSDWGLGKENYQEIWVFNIASNGVIFGCEPLGELSNKYPFDILVDEIDGYTIAPKSTLERIKPLNDVMTWLINTHFYNVRQTLNNQFVVDPTMMVMKDIENPEPGKLIRLKPAAYGKDIRTMIHQLQTVDVTGQHIADVNLWQDFIQRVTGVNDTVMGMVNSGGRKTATEVRSSTSFGINRLKTQCEWFSTTGFGPYAQKIIQRTQQHYSVERQYRMVGDLSLLAPQFAMITPDQIAGFYDYEPVDGTLPVDRFAQANLWKELMAQVATIPQVSMQYDIAKIFAWVANLAGIKNMAQFRVVPDAMALQNMQAGNVVPISSAQREVGNLNEPRQIAGVGPTG